MFCPNCGRQLPDDSRFCSGCGINLKKAAAVFGKMPYSDQNRPETAGTRSGGGTLREPSSAASRYAGEGRLESDSAAARPAGDGRWEPDAAASRFTGESRTGVLPVIPREAYDTEAEEEGGRRKPNLLIIGLILATFFASLIIIIVIFSGVSKDSTAVIYLSDTKYGVIGDLESGTAIDLVGSKTDEAIPNLQFCSNGRTVYFLTRYDGTSGNLNRTDLSKLRVTGGRNEDQIEQVASDVAAFEACGEDAVLYSTASRTLYYYNGAESTQIGKLVCHYRIDDKGRILYAAGENDDLTVYGALLTDPDNRQKLVSGLNGDAAAALFEGPEAVSFDHIPFLQDGGLYTAGFDRQPQMVVQQAELGATALSGAAAAAYPRAAFLYLVPSGESFVRYDHLTEDPGAVKDTVIPAPKEESYMVPVYQIAPISDDAASEADYPEPYASCTQTLSGLGGVSIESISRMTGSGERLSAAAAEFLAKYKPLEDEDGLIVVTEEVKADLKKLTEAAGRRNWLMFCLEKKQTGTVLDQEAWVKAQANYREVEKRNARRDALKEPLPLYTLWYFKNGTTTKLQDDVLFLSDPSAEGAVRFITGSAYQEWLERRSFAAMLNQGDEVFQSDVEQMAVVLPGAAVVTIPADALPLNGDTLQASIMLSGNAAAVLTGSGDLYLAPIKNNTVGSFSLEAQKAGLIPTEDNERLYYQANSYRVGNRKYADLYVYENGKNLRLGKELVNDSPVLFCEEGGMLACTDYQSGRGRELTLFTQNGDAKYIADGVTEYQWISQDEIVYLSDGDLYLYRRGSHIRLKNDVEQFWSNGRMKNRTLQFEVVTYN